MNISTYRNRLNTKSIPELRKMAQKAFNAYILKRDSDGICISCGSPNGNQCGHYYSRGSHPGLALEEINCARQCTHCNLYKHGNLIEFRKGLIRKLGEPTLQILDNKAAWYKRHPFKPDRFYYIEKIIKYRSK